MIVDSTQNPLTQPTGQSKQVLLHVCTKSCCMLKSKPCKPNAVGRHCVYSELAKTDKGTAGNRGLQETQSL
jgi:hypothetical protein